MHIRCANVQHRFRFIRELVASIPSGKKLLVVSDVSGEGAVVVAVNFATTSTLEICPALEKRR